MLIEKVVQIKRDNYQTLQEQINEVNKIFSFSMMSDKVVKDIEIMIKNLYLEYTGEHVELQAFVDYDKQNIKFDTNIKFEIYDTITVEI